MTRHTYHKDNTLPDNPNAIFVFGSNLSGIHGAGAAKAAYDHFGAVMGHGEGLAGNSYALPTKSEQIVTLPREIVAGHIHAFLTLAAATPHRDFFVTRIGCGLAGYRDEEIAPLFRGAPPNCSFAEGWQAYLEGVPA